MKSVFEFRLIHREKRSAAKDLGPLFGGLLVRYPSKWLLIALLINLKLLGSSAVRADELQDYAQQCDAAIGATVPDFDCDAGTEVPVTHPTVGTGGQVTLCDRPNRLNQQCDPGSHFQVLTRSNDAYVVGHCRKKGNPAGEYGDIAVIQYNRNNGATCFYQALGSGLPGQVKAPSKGASAWPWISPSGTAGIGCGGCHDNGPFIRSPYLNQVTGPNALPGSDDFGFNKDQPYAFVGKDFASWRAFKVEVAGNECNGCHRLGVNNVRSGNGTALDFGIRATASSETAKNPPSADSPIWMPPVPVQTAFNQTHANSAKAIHDCAIRLQENPLPNTDACRITQFAAAYVAGPVTDVTIWRYTGTPCSGNSCPGWQMLDNNNKTVKIAAFGGLYQLHNDGMIWKSTGAPCSGSSCPGWQLLDNNTKTVDIAADGGALYQLHNDGMIWRYTGTPCSGNSCPGWQLLDNNPRTTEIAAGGAQLYQLHDDLLYQLHKEGTIWRYTGALCSGNACPGWQLLDNNPGTTAITAAGRQLFQLHTDGTIWRYTGTPCGGGACPGWEMLDNNVQTASTAAGDLLHQLHKDGTIWRYTGTPCSGSSCPGWQLLDNNPGTTAIAAAHAQLFQLHQDGTIWRYTGTPCSGSACPGWQLLDNNSQTSAIAAADLLYQLHKDGTIWRYTGTPCSGNACPGWQLLDNNPGTTAITAAGRQLFQLHQDGTIWRYTGTPCSGSACPGWQLLDDNPQAAATAAGDQLFQLHHDGTIWRYTGTPCSGASCPGWWQLDNNPATKAITGSPMQ